MKALAALLTLACALALASPSFADNYPAKNAYGQNFMLCSKTQNGVENTCAYQTGTSFAPSGQPVITGSLAATGTSAGLLPLAGRSFNLALSITGIASAQLERQFPGDTVWYPMGSGGAQRYVWNTTGTATVTVSDIVTETETGVTYRWRVTACTGCTVGYRLEQ